MNTLDVLRYGHQTVLRTVDGMPDDAWGTPNVCGIWSSKDVIAHLASFEQVLAEVLGAVLASGEPTPTLDRFRTQGSFNDDEVAARQDRNPADVLAEYGDANARVMTRAGQLPAEKFRESGLLPWYGREYDLDDFIVYTSYGHKREHCAQLTLFRKRLGR
jgi:hypothetical protein